MYDILRVDVFERLADLKDVLRRFFLCVMVIRLSFEVFVKLSIRTVLQDEINLVVIVEEAVELHDVLVAQMTLYLDFTT